MSEKSRKSALSIGTGSVAGGLTLALAASQPLAGGILVIIGLVLLGAYWYYERKTGKKLVLPEGIDEEYLEEISKEGADELEEFIEQYKQKKDK